MGKHRNPKQEEVLLKFMTEHEALARGYTKGDRVAVESLWLKLSEELNSFGPPIKDCNDWKKVWIDWKTSIRKKLSHNRSETTATGGGDYNQIIITANENEVARMCGFFKVVGGIENAIPFGVENVCTVVPLSSSEDESRPVSSASFKQNSSGAKKKRLQKPLDIPHIVEDEISAFNNIASKIDALTQVVIQGNEEMKKLCELVETATIENQRHNLLMESAKVEKKKA